MLQLVKSQSTVVTYPLLVDTVYTVGRKQGDITFPDDQSVSRVHATILIEHPSGNISEPLLTPVLTLTDLGSKFGTFATQVNIDSKTPVNAREPVTLSVGDKIRFGLQQNEFKVDYTPLVLTSSSLKATAEFKEKVVKLGGHFINEWNSNVTHVVMEALTLTVKTVCALLSAKPIITPQYITEILSSFEEGKPPPDIKEFLPPVVEKSISTVDKSLFYPNTGRTTVFAGKTFLFCTNKHLKKLGVAIEAGGGIVKLVADMQGPDVLGSEYIIMGMNVDVAEGEKDRHTKSILDIYRKGGKRFIPDSEIGLAALHNGIEKHCNPRYSVSNSMLPPLTTQTQSTSGSSVPIVPETQDESCETDETSVHVVNETINQSNDGGQTRSNGLRGVRGEKRSADEAGSSSSKKRSAAESLTRPDIKRLKEVSSSTLSRTRSSKAVSEKPKSTRALNSLFNFSSSDEDDEVSAVPETQPNGSDEDLVPDSQRHLVNVVDVRNLQSMASTQVSVEVPPEDEILMVPASPEMEEPKHNTNRNPGSDFIDTVTTSVMNAKTVPVDAPAPEPNLSKKRAPIRHDSGSGAVAGPSRKRRKEENELNTSVEKTKKSNDQVLKEEEGSSAVQIPLIKKPLMNKNLIGELSILQLNQSDESLQRKNFKTFRKVLPSFLSSRNQENTRGSNNVWVDISIIEANMKPPKMTTYEYSPGYTNYRYGTIPPPLEPKPQRGMDLDTPEGFIKFDDTTPFLENILQRERKKREAAERNAQGEQKQTNNANEPSTATGRRTSPRKKGPAFKLPAPPIRPPTPPPVVQPIDIDDEEDEDDPWSFNR